MGREFLEKIEASPIIAAVKDDRELAKALQSDVDVVFILYGDVCTIPMIVDRIKEAGRTAMVHLDLVAGLSVKFVGVSVATTYLIFCHTGNDTLSEYGKDIVGWSCHLAQCLFCQFSGLCC